MVLNEELNELNATLACLTKKVMPRLLSRFGVGPRTASTLLITAGDIPPVCAAKQRWRHFAEPVRYWYPPARSSAIGSIVAEIAKPTTRCEPLQWFECQVLHAPGNMSRDERVREC